MIVSSDFSPLLEDFDKSERLTMAAILKYFENAGSRHSDAAGDSAIKVSETLGVAWVLTDWKVCVKEFPRYGQKIKFATTTCTPTETSPWREPASGSALTYGLAGR